MYKADWRIERKLRAYDRHLFLKFNNRAYYFELWRKMPHGERLITPVTESIYKRGAPMTFVWPDERLLDWLARADSWKFDNKKQWAKDQHEKWIENNKKQKAKRKQHFKDVAKDTYNLVNYHFVTKHGPGTTRKEETAFIPPDAKKVSSGRVMSRTAANASRYFRSKVK